MEEQKADELELYYCKQLFENEWLERLIIGRILRNPKLVKRLIARGITRHSFIFANTREVFRAMEQLTRQQKKADINNIVFELREDIEDIGGLLMLKDCMKVAANTASYIKNEEAMELFIDSDQFRQFHFLTNRYI